MAWDIDDHVRGLGRVAIKQIDRTSKISRDAVVDLDHGKLLKAIKEAHELVISLSRLEATLAAEQFLKSSEQ